jgi:hypothetical protein
VTKAIRAAKPEAVCAGKAETVGTVQPEAVYAANRVAEEPGDRGYSGR